MATDFGTDLSCFPDLDPSGALVSGIVCLEQALLRRLITPRGGLFYDPSYGTDIRGFVGEAIATNNTSPIQRAIEQEVTQDERIFAATASVTFNQVKNALICHLTIQTSDGPFSLVLAIGSLTVAILKTG